MKALPSILFLLLLSPSIFYAQNYQAFRSDRVAYFQQKQGTEIQAVRIDSAISQQEVTLYPFSQIVELSFDCFDSNGPHWIGQKMHIQPDGDHLFFNKFGDTIRFKTFAAIGTEWMIYKPVNGFKVKGYLKRTTEEPFLGITDSVKWISFQVLDQNDRPIDHRLNDMVVKFSKEYGILQTLNFQLFPFYEDDYFGETVQELKLVGLSDPEIGVQNLTWMEVHDFETGDEIHTERCFIEWHLGQEPNSIIKKRKEKYLDKTITGSSVSYLISVEEKTTQIYLGDTTFNYKNEEITKIYEADYEFDHLPGEPVKEQGGGFYFHSMFQEDFLSKTLPAIPETFFPRDLNQDTCMMMSFADGCYSHYHFYEKLGGPYYFCKHVFDLGWEERRLVYYKKGSEEWGEPLDLSTNLEEVNESTDIKVSPNPATSFIDINLGNLALPAQIAIFSYDGRLLKLERLNSPNVRVNLNTEGLLLYQIRSSKGTLLKAGKIIARNP